MGKIMEALFCVFYLIFTTVVGVNIVKKSKGRRQVLLFGIMTLILVFGDAFHLIPRITTAINPAGDYAFALGIGKMITSITMTFFYLFLYLIYEIRYEKRNVPLRILVIILSCNRVYLCLLSQNNWTGEDPVTWGIYRNIPFVILGLIMVILFLKERSDKYYKWMWLAILLSFMFYIPVVLWADISPMIGMMMLPKTCMYMWMVIMGYKQIKAEQ